MNEQEIGNMEQLLSFSREELMLRAGEAVFEQQNIRFAFPPSVEMLAEAGLGWWNDFRKNYLCPLLKSNPAFRLAIVGAPGLKVMERAGAISLALNAHFPQLGTVFALIATALILDDVIEVICKDVEVNVVV